MTHSNPHLETVLDYARRGWHMLPCHSAPGGKCSCGKSDCHSPGKHSRIDGWPDNATIDEKQIDAWVARWPNCSWAVPTGPKSGMLVLDVDGEAGRASLAVLEEKYGPLPTTLTSTTGRGAHRWFRYPAGRTVRNSAGKLGLGLDVRGDGGCVIVPPSIHANGTPYRWLAPNESIADAPEWLLELIAERPAINRAQE